MILSNARLVMAPGRIPVRGSLVIREGLIEAVGDIAPPPADAVVLDMAGRTVYPGFIDLHSHYGLSEMKTNPSESGAVHPNPHVRPERRASSYFRPDKEAAAMLREAGFTVVQMLPSKGIFKGSGALVLLEDSGLGELILKDGVSQSVSFEVPREETREGRRNPASLMGCVALIRQTLLDGQWYGEARKAYSLSSRGNYPPGVNLSLAALQPIVEGRQMLLFESSDALDVLRAARLAREFDLDVCVSGSGFEYRYLDAVAESGVRLILPLNFPEPPKGFEQDIELRDLRHWDFAPENAGRLADRGIDFALTASGLEDPRIFPSRLREAVRRGLDKDMALAALTTIPAQWMDQAEALGRLEKGHIANLVITDGDIFDEGTSVLETWVAGRRYESSGSRDSAIRAGRKKIEPSSDSGRVRMAEFPLVYPEGAFGRTRLPKQPEALLIKNAVIWTCGPEGVLDKADLLVTDGKIAAMGSGLSPPDGARIIEAAGRHVTPGIIDAHTHIAAAGGLNESSGQVTPEVRAEDVLDNSDINIYRLLAGGITSVGVLHGSGNPIGGQNAVIKLRWGALPDDMMLKSAAPSVKFALGENVKNPYGEYPDTRMGVDAVMREAFLAAGDYRRRWDEYERSVSQGRSAIPPRRELRNEALLQILDGNWWVRCHAYLQDEILALIRLAEEFGFTLKVIEHGNEAYKIADILVERGVTASVHADWWMYKFEVYDGIPHNGALMHDQGVTVSFNSDNAELSRRLNYDAAKAVKFGGVPPEEALRFVTLNPARQMGIDDRVGSLEPGKDADFVIWSGSPLSTYSRCESTWIDGRRYFDRDEDKKMREEAQRQKETLMQKAAAVRKSNPGGSR